MNQVENIFPWTPYPPAHSAQGKAFDPKETMHDGDVAQALSLATPSFSQAPAITAYEAYPPEHRNLTNIFREVHTNLKGSAPSFLLMLFLYGQLVVFTCMITWFFLVPWHGSVLTTTFNDILIIISAVIIVLVPLAGGIPGIGLLLATGFTGMFESTLLEYLDLTFRYLALYLLIIAIPFALAYLHGPEFLLLVPLFAAPLAFTGVFMADQNLRLFPAMKASALFIKQNFALTFHFTLRILGLYLLGILALGIGVLWVIPRHIAAVGILYKSVHGLEHMAPNAPHSPSN